MSDLSSDQLKDAILRGLKAVQDRFARDPNPTDGSVRSEQQAARISSHDVTGTSYCNRSAAPLASAARRPADGG